MQQINFYLPEFHPNNTPFRFVQILVATAVVVCILIATSISSHFKNQALAIEVSEKAELVKKNLEQFQQYSSINKGVNLVDLDNQILSLTSMVKKKQELLQVISYQDLGNNRGFSMQLEGMAKQSHKDISLQVFSLKQGGTYLEIAGLVTAAEFLPAYIQGLKSEVAFEKISFGVVAIEPAKANGLYQFSVVQPLGDAKPQIKVSAVQEFVKKQQSDRGIK